MKKFLKGAMLSLGTIAMLGAGSLAYATEYDAGDVTPPWGRIIIADATEVDNINYVDREEVTVQIYARDDKSDEIYYYLSTSPISTTTKITNWKLWSTGATEVITLPSITSTNTIYAAFKDKNGNTSIIFDSSLSHTIVYNTNADSTATGITGVDTTVTYGESHVITMQRPKWEGHYFLGWSTSASATTASYAPGDVIAYNELAGLGDTINLYAIWTTKEAGLPLLSSVVSVGDYVNYPVVYDNLTVSYTSIYKGWRVLSVDSDGTVNLVSGGIPLTFYHASDSSSSVTALTTNFLTTPFTTSGIGYRKTGFGPYTTLTEVFTNEYTKLSNGLPVVRAMTKDDVDKVVGTTTSTSTILGAAKYNGLFYLGTWNDTGTSRNNNSPWYWLASAYSSHHLWRVYNLGYLDNNNGCEYGVRPVVSLKSEVRASGQDAIGAWNIVMP